MYLYCQQLTLGSKETILENIFNQNSRDSENLSTTHMIDINIHRQQI